MLWGCSVTRLQAAGVGINTLLDWLGEGGVPVAQFHADERAAVCEICPKNKPGNWWDKLGREVVQVVIAQRRAKEALDLHLKCEPDLHFCEVCHCDLKTKPWVPFSHIAARTKDKTWQELPDWCWLNKERGA